MATRAINVRFLGTTCRACSQRSLCTRSKTEPRELTFQPQAQQIAIQSRRQAQQTPEWNQVYNQRAGIEATHSRMYTAFGTAALSLHRFS